MHPRLKQSRTEERVCRLNCLPWRNDLGPPSRLLNALPACSTCCEFEAKPAEQMQAELGRAAARPREVRKDFTCCKDRHRQLDVLQLSVANVLHGIGLATNLIGG